MISMDKEASSELFERVLTRFEQVLEKAERLLEDRLPVPSYETLDTAAAFIWQQRGGVGLFRPVRHIDRVRLEDLLGIDYQLKQLVRNTRQFVQGAPANHVLLWGERGTGKSSAVKALLFAFAREGLRLVQVHRQDLLDLPEIIDALWDRPEKYILFCDDLSFEASDAEYKELKALLEGGLHARSTNVLIYATSNRRHLMQERFTDRQATADNDEVHAMDAVEEQLSLADRFGLRLSFYKIDQDTYLQIVRHLAGQRNLDIDSIILERDALRWALSHSGRSGRCARQFIDDQEGRLAIEM